MTPTLQIIRIACDAEPSASDGELLHRYVDHRDEAAFAEVVRRHGPLVLRTCRTIVGESAADDAFQATFLVLARKAHRLTRPGSLAGWLHATAVRIARAARRSAARTREREQALGTVPAAAPDDRSWREVCEILGTELAALPERYRTPLVLCCVQELSYAEAARQAACSVGALRGRLERAKQRLRKRLARHGLPLAAPLLVLGPPTTVSATLLDKVLSSVLAARNGGVIAPSVAGLAGQSGWLRTAVLIPTLTTIIALGAVAAAGLPSSDPPPIQPNAPPTPPDAPTAEPGPRTDLFGDALPEGVVMRLGTVRSRAAISSFGILPDGTVVTVGRTPEVRTWSPTSDKPGAPVRLPLTDPDLYLYPQVSADGRFIAAGTRDKVVVWERPTPDVKQVATFGIKQAQKLALSPDGIYLAVAYERARHEQRVALCEVRTGTIRELEPGAGADALVFSGDGRRLMAGSHQRAVLWDVRTGKQLADHKGGKVGDVPSALNQSGDVIAVLPYTWGKDRVRFLDAATGQPIAGLTGPPINGERWVVFAPDGKTVLVGGPDGVRWWDSAAGKPIRTFAGSASVSGGFVRPLGRFTPGRKVLVAHNQHMLQRWDAATGKPLFPASHATGHTEEVAALGVSPEGTRVATLGWEPGVRVWDTRTARQLAVLPAAWFNEKDFDFSPDGKFLFARSRDGAAVVKWNLATGTEAARYEAGPKQPWGGDQLAFRLSPDGRTLHALARARDQQEADKRERMRILDWDVASGHLRSEVTRLVPPRHETGVWQFTPDGRWLSGGGLLLRSASGSEARMLGGAEFASFSQSVFSADSRLVAVAAYSGSGEDRVNRATVVEIASGTIVRQMPIRWSVTLAFHPDGRTLAGAELDRLVFWNLVTGKEFARHKAHAPHPGDPTQPFARVLRYFPDGSKLISGHADTTALVWNAPTRPKSARALDAKERVAAWDDLISADGAKGWAAVWALADDPGAAAFLRDRIKPVEPFPAEEFNSLLADLGNDDFATREAATKKLEKAGDRATGQLRAALKTNLSAEQRRRIGTLPAIIGGADAKPLSGERLRTARAVAALELASTPDARKLLSELAGGAVGAQTTEEAKRSLEQRYR
jgi:RNA polymerase sigma factor (sigma-70 family)